MRPTLVRCSHTNRAMRRRSGFVKTPATHNLAPGMTLVEKTALLASSTTKVTKAA
ncbi:hypothetical protein [Vibrio tetraodonis]|uniref:hypothetical protein n=1 Tax=Vibrio tetraodonis TaxID=2231647 RepID=UPI0019626862|nr:hypothetical protein [Vibrio tetraodonis]